MKNGRSLAVIEKELEKLERTKEDFVVPANEMHMNSDAQTFYIPKKGSIPMDDNFHDQLGAAMKIPMGYYGLCLREKPDLLAKNVNAWLADKNRSYLVRTIDYGNGPTSRAFLSDRYRIIDNLPLLNAAMPVIGNHPEWVVRSSEMTHNRFFIKIVNKNMEKDVVPGDTIRAGVMISNSEVGLGRVTATPFTERLICTNGMVSTIVGIGLKKRHLGGRISSNDIVAFNDDKFLVRFGEAVEEAMADASFDYTVARMSDAAKRHIDGDLEVVMKNLTKELGITKKESDGIFLHFVSDADFTQYGLANAVTRYSQDIDDYEKATDFEALGWNVLNFTPTVWKRLMAA